MVPVLNRPIMSHIVNLLKKHHLTQIGVTLQYLPEEIRNHFGHGGELGVYFKYFVEESPLGTAGSVKNAQGFLDETFLVISGDALTDFNLSEAMAFHKEKGSLVTLVLTRVSCPLEYGVVITDEDARITQFLEKPSWGEVFSDTVNTGIYIMEPEVLEYIPTGQKFDFSKDLFPLLMSKGKSMYGVVLSGYWCDIGDLKQYLQAQYDFLSGRVALPIEARQVSPGVYLEDDVRLDPSVEINGPVLIGAGTTVGKGTKIDQFSVLGSGCLVQEYASIKRSVLWNNVFVAPGAHLRGAILGSRVQVQAGTSIYEGAVVGSDTVLQERCVIKPDVKLWPHKVVETGSAVGESLVWGNRIPRRVFGLEGVSGLINVEITPEFIARLAAAYASTLGPGASICVTSDAHPPSGMIRRSVVSGLQSTGALVFDAGDAITPMHRFAVKQLNCEGGIHVRLSPGHSKSLNIMLTNKQGVNIARSMERKIENLLAREDFQRADFQAITRVQSVANLPEKYVQGLLDRVQTDVIRERGLSLAAVYDNAGAGHYLEQLCRKLNITLERVDTSEFGSYPLDWSQYRKIADPLARAVTASGHAMGIIVDAGADHLVLIDNLGRTIQDDLLVALFALLTLRSRGGSVVVPVTAPRVVESLAQKYSAQVVRTKTALQDFYEALLSQDGATELNIGQITQSMLYFDALAGILKVVEYIARDKVSLADLIDEIPAYFMDQKETRVPWEAKGTVIRSLIQEMRKEKMELQDGVKVYHSDGWALVLPDPEEPLCRVFSEGSTMEIAESLADFYIKKIDEIVGPVQKIS